MNDEQRKALVHLLQTVMEISYKMGQQRSHYDVADEAKRLADVIEDDFLTGRAMATVTAAQPDAEAVDAVAKGLFDHENESLGAIASWDELLENYGRNGVAGKAVYRDLARAAITAMPAPDDNWLDKALDSVPPQTRIEHFPYYRMQDDNLYHCKLSVPVFGKAITGSHRPVYGTGPTRKAAILDACAKAKEASDATD